MRAAALLLGVYGLSRNGGSDVDLIAHPGIRALYFLSPILFTSEYGYSHMWTLAKDYFSGAFTTQEPAGLLIFLFLIYAGWFTAFGFGILTRSHLARVAVSATFSLEIVKVLYLFSKSIGNPSALTFSTQALLSFVVVADALLLLGVMYLKPDSSDSGLDSI